MTKVLCVQASNKEEAKRIADSCAHDEATKEIEVRRISTVKDIPWGWTNARPYTSDYDIGYEDKDPTCKDIVLKRK